MRRIRGRFTYSNVMATVAVFIALGGGAYALSRGEVKSRNIASNAVKSRHVGDNRIKGKDVDEASLSRIGGGVMLASLDDFGNAVGSGLFAPLGPSHLFTDNGLTVAPQTFVARDLRVLLADPLSNGTMSFFLYKDDGGDTPLSCSIDIDADSCQSDARVTVAQGDSFAFRVSFNTTDIHDAAVGWRATSP